MTDYKFPTNKYLKKMKPYSAQSIAKTFYGVEAPDNTADSPGIPSNNRFSGKRDAIDRVAKEIAISAMKETEYFWNRTIGFHLQYPDRSQFDSARSEMTIPIWMYSNWCVIVGDPQDNSLYYATKVELDKCGMQGIPNGTERDFHKALASFVEKHYKQIFQDKYGQHIISRMTCSMSVEHANTISLQCKEQNVEGMELRISFYIAPQQSRSSLESW